ncbi:MAG: type II secretion system protein N [Thiomicrorhabdus chilensis]|uniref:type II secretion system protein N n=1 Tax=Thiomicrorhabdus chilensis TaxID=63656 RepID=UPI00299DEE5E|nr:type II secretion system protein N [Thiomicrorhabdus chilensis]MDX1347647.1 type II secretion system protein N [Thiomicrorhabdus chilensis]
MSAKRVFISKLWLGLVFAAVVLVSFAYHLPASWVLQQLPAQAKQQLEQKMFISDVQGSLWSGQLKLGLNQAKQNVPLGTLSWQLNPWALLAMNLNADMQIVPSQGAGGLDWQLSTGLLNQQSIELADLNGKMEMSALQGMLPASVKGLGELKGQLSFQQINVVWDTQLQWATQLSGDVKVAQLDVMGAQIPHLSLTPSLKGKQIQVAAQGGDKAWQLNGSSLLNAKSFQHNFTIKADGANNMPPWVDLVMRKKTPTLATFNQKGRW